MPVIQPLHIAASVLIAACLHVLHSREHAPEKFITMTRQSEMASLATRCRKTHLASYRGGETAYCFVRSRQIPGVRAAVWRWCRPRRFMESPAESMADGSWPLRSRLPCLKPARLPIPGCGGRLPKMPMPQRLHIAVLALAGLYFPVGYRPRHGARP